MDALIVVIFAIVVSVIRMNKSPTAEKIVIEGQEVTPITDTTLEIGTNLNLRYEPDAFELILKEFNLR